jgi:hypothetical protein
MYFVKSNIKTTVMDLTRLKEKIQGLLEKKKPGFKKYPISGLRLVERMPKEKAEKNEFQKVGHPEDFLVEVETWMLRYIIIDIHNELTYRKVVVAPTGGHLNGLDNHVTEA